MTEPLTDEQMDEVLARMRSIAQAVMGEPVPDVHETPWDWTISGTSAAQLAHIEAFQPSTVLAMLDEVDRLRAQLTAYDRAATERDELQERLFQIAALREVEMWREADAE